MMKRLISIFVVAIFIVFLIPLENIFAEEYDFRNGLLDDTKIIKFNNLPIQVYDNDLETEETVSNENYITFNTLVNIKAIYIKRGKISPFILDISYYDENLNVIVTEIYSSTKEGYIEVNRDNVLQISFMRGSTNRVDLAEFDVFGTYDLDIQLPNIPEDITNLDFEVTTDTATFNYDLPSDEDFSHVNVYFNNEVYQTTDTTFILENLSPNTDYEITFKTVNTEGIESLGTTVTFKTDDLPPPPPLEETDIHNLKAEVSADRVDLTWNNPKTDKFEKAIIYRATLTSNQQTSFLDYFKPLKVHADELKPIFETNGTTFADLTIQPEQQYQYKVTAMIDGTETEGATVTTDPIPKPPPFDFKEVELPFTASNIIKSAFEFIGFFGAFILLALAIRLTPRLVKLIRRSSVNRSRAR